MQGFLQLTIRTVHAVSVLRYLLPWMQLPSARCWKLVERVEGKLQEKMGCGEVQ